MAGNVRTFVRAEREQTIKDHDEDGGGFCKACPDEEYPCAARLFAERAAVALDNRSQRWPRTEEAT